MENAIMTVKEAAAILRISSSAMYRLVREEKVPYISVGKRRVIPVGRFYAWLDTVVKGGQL